MTYNGISWVFHLTENKILLMAYKVLSGMAPGYFPAFSFFFYWAPSSDLLSSNPIVSSDFALAAL